MSIVGKYELLSDPTDKAFDEYLIAVGKIIFRKQTK